MHLQVQKYVNGYQKAAENYEKNRELQKNTTKQLHKYTMRR